MEKDPIDVITDWLEEGTPWELLPGHGRGMAEYIITALNDAGYVVVPRSQAIMEGDVFTINATSPS